MMKNTYLVNRKIGWQHSNLDDYLEAFSKLRLDVLGSTLLSGGDYLHLQQNLPQGKFIMIKCLRSCDPPKHWKLPRTIMANLAMIWMSMIIISKWSCELRWEREIKKDDICGSKPGIDLNKYLWLWSSDDHQVSWDGREKKKKDNFDNGNFV